MSPMAKPFSQACENNREPILSVLAARLTHCRRVLEIGSGTGQHAFHFAAALPHLHWQTSDLPEHHAGIRAWLADYPGDNLGAPLALDVTQPDWPVAEADAVFTANTCHIMPWEAVLAMLDGCARLLPPGGPLVIYGPFHENGRATSDSNAAFDRRLREQAPHQGIRDRQTLVDEAARRGLVLNEVHSMPANNQTLVLER